MQHVTITFKFRSKYMRHFSVPINHSNVRTLREEHSLPATLTFPTSMGGYEIVNLAQCNCIEVSAPYNTGAVDD